MSAFAKAATPRHRHVQPLRSAQKRRATPRRQAARVAAQPHARAVRSRAPVAVARWQIALGVLALLCSGIDLG